MICDKLGDPGLDWDCEEGRGRRCFVVVVAIGTEPSMPQAQTALGSDVLSLSTGIAGYWGEKGDLPPGLERDFLTCESPCG